MKIEQAKQVAGKAIEELNKALERGHSEGLVRYLTAMARFHRYSVCNVILILSQTPQATRVAGYQTWKQFGRYVKKGARGILVFAPIFRKWKPEESGQDEKLAKVLLGFRGLHVFDQADTGGPSVPDFAKTEGDPTGHTDRLRAFVAQRGIQLEYSEAVSPRKVYARSAR